MPFSCSPWFDARLKVHKSTREHINIEQCNDYEIFYALLTYCYTGNIVLDQHNVPELLSLAVLFQMVKLKSYCCEYLCRNLNAKNVHTAVELAIRLNLGDLMRRSFSFLQVCFLISRNFCFLIWFHMFCLHFFYREVLATSSRTIERNWCNIQLKWFKHFYPKKDGPYILNWCSDLLPIG